MVLASRAGVLGFVRRRLDLKPTPTLKLLGSCCQFSEIL